MPYFLVYVWCKLQSCNCILLLVIDKCSVFRVNLVSWYERANQLGMDEPGTYSSIKRLLCGRCTSSLWSAGRFAEPRRYAIKLSNGGHAVRILPFFIFLFFAL